MRAYLCCAMLFIFCTSYKCQDEFDEISLYPNFECYFKLVSLTTQRLLGVRKMFFLHAQERKRFVTSFSSENVGIKFDCVSRKKVNFKRKYLYLLIKREHNIIIISDATKRCSFLQLQLCEIPRVKECISA